MDKATMRGLMQFGEHLIDKDLTDNRKITIEANIPIIKAVDFKPTAFIGENLAMSSLAKDVKREGTVHYFMGDYRLGAVYNKIMNGVIAKYLPPKFWVEEKTGEDYRLRKEKEYNKYIEKLRHFEAVCSPDHSVYADFCNPNNLLSVWKNRIIGYIWQNEGLTVIPTVTWSDERTYEYAFCGLEKNGTYAISANGCFSQNQNIREISLGIYKKGLVYMLRELDPCRIIVHGSKELPEADYGDAEVMFFKSVISDEANYRGYRKAKAEEGLTGVDINIGEKKHVESA